MLQSPVAMLKVPSHSYYNPEQTNRTGFPPSTGRGPILSAGSVFLTCVQEFVLSSIGYTIIATTMTQGPFIHGIPD
jgi:hypothetical protein